jgi:hypothetical protein
MDNTYRCLRVANGVDLLRLGHLRDQISANNEDTLQLPDCQQCHYWSRSEIRIGRGRNKAPVTTSSAFDQISLPIEP